MSRHIHIRLPVLTLLALLTAPAAHAQWAVIDVQAVARLAQEVQTLQQALATAQGQLLQARQTLQSLTGTRGMQGLLAGTQRNYLPTDWGSIERLATSTAGSYAALASNLQHLVASDAVLPDGLLASLAPQDRARIAAERDRVAMAQVLFRSALANSSGRFSALQTLIDAISGATDPKAILDLQARIGAENAMLQNERTKLQALAQAMQADRAAASERIQEAVVAAHGRFESRFQPAP